MGGLCYRPGGTDLDAAEMAAVDALERLLEAARDHPTLRRQMCTHLFPLSLEPWTGGGASGRFSGGSSGGSSDGGSGVGVGARRCVGSFEPWRRRRTPRADARFANCAACGALDAAATHLSPADGAVDLDPIGRRRRRIV